MGQKKIVTEEVIGVINTMIRNGEIKPGERFPAERTLAQKLGVSRNTVREVLNYFEAIGLASTRRGSGTYLVDDSETLQKVMEARSILEQYNWTEMVQARRVLEIGIVRIAAQNANREDKLALRNALKVVDATSLNAKTDEGLMEHLLADFNFHRQIARSTHNTMLIELQFMMKTVMLSSTKVWKTVTDTYDVANPAHARIVESISNNDPDAAEEAMETHLQHMEYLIELSRRKNIAAPTEKKKTV